MLGSKAVRAAVLIGGCSKTVADVHGRAPHVYIMLNWLKQAVLKPAKAETTVGGSMEGSVSLSHTLVLFEGAQQGRSTCGARGMQGTVALLAECPELSIGCQHGVCAAA